MIFGLLKKLLIFVALLLASCAMAYGPEFKSAESVHGNSLIYIYRVPTISGFAVSAKPMISVDGIGYRTIKNGGYFPIHIKPGSHTVSFKHTLWGRPVGEVQKTLAFDIEAGEIKYFEYSQVTTGYKRYGDTEVAQVSEQFIEVPPAFAAQRIRKTRLLSVE